jgi:hypothetical protein
MFDDFEENDQPVEKSADPLVRAAEKFDEFRMHAELAAVFEGKRKFDAELRPTVDANLAREIQRTVATLEKSKLPDLPIISPDASDAARELLEFPKTRQFSTNDYHVHRRPGEVMIVRFLAGEQVDSFYARLQAHFDAALNQYREEERQQHGWKQDEQTIKYLDALDKIDVKMADRYSRDAIKKIAATKVAGQLVPVFVLSTQTADEIDIVHLTDYLMGVSPQELVGEHSAPPEDGPTEIDRTWFFKLFSLRGIVEKQERMCFFTFMQKSDADW